MHTHDVEVSGLSSDPLARIALKHLDDFGPDALASGTMNVFLACEGVGATSTGEVLHRVAEELNVQTMAAYEPTPDWQERLRRIATCLWRVHSEHLAAASLCFTLVTDGPGEIAVEGAILSAIDEAGWTGVDATREFVAFVSFLRSLSAGWATFLMRAPAEDDDLVSEGVQRPTRLQEAQDQIDEVFVPDELFASQVADYVAAMAWRAERRSSTP